MNKDKIPFTTIASRLERVLHADVGMNGLEILLYGWRKKRGIHPCVMASRAKLNDGQPYLTQAELLSFSFYAGYDLTR